MIRDKTWLWVFLIGLCAACADMSDSESEPTRTRHAQLGEPQGDYPSWEERVILYLTNRARTEPSAFNPALPHEPSAPLWWNLELAQAARFHARHIVEASCWCQDHSSCCELERVGDEVQCAGPISGCGAMDASSRVALWSSAYSGENMAMGQTSPHEAVEGWIFSEGHWANMNNPGSTMLGPGHHQNAWVQDFGAGGSRPGPIVDGIHFTRGGTTTFGITYFQPGTGGPQVALVIVDGECHELELVHGIPERGAFEASLALEPGCHRYYFHFTDGEGVDHVYPSEGSLGVAIGGAEQCELYLDMKPADTCSPSGQTCETGHTRTCYTGPFGTRDVGECLSGVERCVGGQWTGECRGQILPQDDDMCGDQLDEDCDGEVDEECDTADDVGAADVGISQQDAGPSPDASAAEEQPLHTKESPGCQSTPVHGTKFNWIALLAFVLALAGRASRHRRLIR